MLGSPSCAGAINGQADPAAILKGFVPLGTLNDGEQSLPGRTRIQAFREVAQRIFGKRAGKSKILARRRTYQRFHSMKAGLTKDLPNQQTPKQKLGGNLPLPPAVSRILEVAPKSQTPRHKMKHTTWRRPAHFFFFFLFFSCCFANTSSWTLAANTSLTASCNFRPAATRRSTSSAHCAGMRSTCRRPWIM